jgi:hypothetical protein
VFTPAERERLREGLVSTAYTDTHITGAAVTGSAAVGREDRWSDIDLALCVAADADFGQVLADWTDRMYREHAAVHFGTANQRPTVPAPAAAELIGMGWLYALHARSSIARGRVWQAEYMISSVRDHVLALACLRHGVPPVQGRGMDSLPPEITAALAEALVCSLDIVELRHAFGVISGALLVEIEWVDAGLANRLAGPLRELAS